MSVWQGGCLDSATSSIGMARLASLRLAELLYFPAVRLHEDPQVSPQSHTPQPGFWNDCKTPLGFDMPGSSLHTPVAKWRTTKSGLLVPAEPSLLDEIAQTLPTTDVSARTHAAWQTWTSIISALAALLAVGWTAISTYNQISQLKFQIVQDSRMREEAAIDEHLARIERLQETVSWWEMDGKIFVINRGHDPIQKVTLIGDGELALALASVVPPCTQLEHLEPVTEPPTQLLFIKAERVWGVSAQGRASSLSTGLVDLASPMAELFAKTSPAVVRMKQIDGCSGV